MLIRLHKNARTTPAVRREIQDSDLGERALAKRHNISRATARKWRKRRDSTADGSHRPRTLRATLSPAQEAAAAELRRTLRLPLDDLVAVVREFIHPEVSRSGLDRCPRRHGVSNLKALLPAPSAVPAKTFKDYAPGHGRLRPRLPGRPGEGRALRDPQAPRRQRQGLHRPLRRPRRARADRPGTPSTGAALSTASSIA